jgi:WD40 repeat protein
VAISPDGKTVASGSADTSIKLWDIKTGKEIRPLAGHSGFVFSVAISPDGKTLTSGSWDTSIKLWDIATGKEIRSLIGHSSTVNSVAISPDGKTVAGGTGSGSCLLLEIARKGKKVTELRQKATLWHLPDGQWAALDARNHYVCSKQGLPFISFADRLTNYPATVVPELERPNGLSII